MARELDRNKLLDFWRDKGMLEEVQNFFFAHLDQLALNKVYNKEVTVGIADAKEAIIAAFKQLDEEFVVQEDKKERLNQAR